jgi:tripartite-type tricarboxylate transporter receptor subunit TctC
VSLVTRFAPVLVINPSLPAGDLKEFIALAKANPGKFSYGSSGPGTAIHLASELFKAAAGVDIVHIPYKGAANGITDLLAGQVDLTFEPISVLVGHIRDGTLRALALTGGARSAELPDVPTMVECGYSSVVSVSWSGVVAPAGTPDAIVSRLNTAVNAALATPDMQTALARLGAAPQPGTPAAFADFIAAETPKWAAVVKAARITVE